MNPRQVPNPKSHEKAGGRFLWNLGFETWKLTKETRVAAGPTPAGQEIYSPGLEGITAGETAISTLTGGLSYRGYPVVELAEQCSFDEVAYLLLYGELPKAAELAAFKARVAAARSVPEPLFALLKALPKNVIPMDALRTSVSVLAHYDPDVSDGSPAADRRKAERLLGQIPVAIALQYRLARGLEPIPPRPDLDHAAHFLYLLRGSEASPADVRALDVSLILYAEHEFNASTFTARVIVSTESDLHSAVVGAIGALKGRLHGGANERVMEVLEAAGDPTRAEAWLRGMMARKERVMGFGHRVYKTGDVRATVLKKYAQEAAEARGLTKWEETAAVIERILGAEKNLFPNLDWPAGRLYHALGLDVGLYTPMFVMARVAGWCAHVIEQAEHNRLIRPRSRYVGPGQRAVKSLRDRG
jgi:2-methylcitrate synthase/citrate synthase II